MTRFEKKNLLRVKLESIFRRMRNGEPLNEDERYLYFTVYTSRRSSIKFYTWIRHGFTDAGIDEERREIIIRQ